MTETDFISTGPESLAGRYLRQFWQPVCLAEALAPGRARPLTIMGQRIALYRSADGTVHCVDDRCAHRGASLGTGWVEGDAIRCPYHGWAYGPDGGCVHQPFETAAYARRIRIGAYPARDYLGLIFVYLGEGEAPEFPLYPEWENSTFVVAMAETMPCNWFQNVENLVDQAHLWVTHLHSAAAGSDRLGRMPAVRSESTPWGLCIVTTQPDGSVRRLQFGMPSIAMFMIGDPGDQVWQLVLDYRVPVTDERHLQLRAVAVFARPEDEAAARARWAAFQAGEADAARAAARVLGGDLAYDDIAKACVYAPLAQDIVILAGQGTFASRQRGVEHLGASDVGIVALRRLYETELGALASGSAPKAWLRPPGLLPSSGNGEAPAATTVRQTRARP